MAFPRVFTALPLELLRRLLALPVLRLGCFDVPGLEITRFPRLAVNQEPGGLPGSLALALDPLLPRLLSLLLAVHVRDYGLRVGGHLDLRLLGGDRHPDEGVVKDVPAEFAKAILLAAFPAGLHAALDYAGAILASPDGARRRTSLLHYCLRLQLAHFDLETAGKHQIRIVAADYSIEFYTFTCFSIISDEILKFIIRGKSVSTIESYDMRDIIFIIHK